MADMGLLLGAPVLNNTLENIAQQLTEHLSLNFKEDNRIKYPRIVSQEMLTFNGQLPIIFQILKCLNSMKIKLCVHF